MAVRYLVPEPFQVEHHLIGRPLASPSRRFLAFLIDALLVVFPTLAVVVGAAALSLYLTDRASFDAVRHLDRWDDKNPTVALAEKREMVPLLVRVEAPGLPPSVAVAVEERNLDRAAMLLDGYMIGVALKSGEGGDEVLGPTEIRLPIERLIPDRIREITLLGVPALYFAGFARTKRRATPGKRCMGIHIARLDGEKLSWLEALERFVGYIHIPATASISLLDLWRDPNRQLPHDRTVHTVVLKGRPVAAPAPEGKPVAGPESQAETTGTVPASGATTSDSGSSAPSAPLP
jgi:uncharacterized RDD family membrane protein YckC